MDIPAAETDAPKSFAPLPPQEFEALFPHLEILGLIGAGGMGAVYQARQRELDRLVALKILPPDIGEVPGLPRDSRARPRP